jgi:DNA transposition AAA+ family ATPase
MDYQQLAQLFEEEKNPAENFYKNHNVLQIESKMMQILKNSHKQLLFLIGDAGVGKSAFLNYFAASKSVEAITFDVPFFEPVDFVKTLITRSGVSIEGHSLVELIEQVSNIYRDKETVVMVDEAQLLSHSMIETIRILADSKAFWFVLAMHKHESKKLLNEPQFTSRPHKVLEMGQLSFEEAKGFVHTTLRRGEFEHLWPQVEKNFSSLYKLSRGNFRDLKKLLHTTFLLIHFAMQSGKKKFSYLHKRVIIMAAIENGLINV